MTGVLIRGGDTGEAGVMGLQAKERRPPPELEKARKVPLVEALESTQHLDFQVLAPRALRNTFLLFEAAQFVVLCYGSPSK